MRMLQKKRLKPGDRISSSLCLTPPFKAILEYSWDAGFGKLLLMGTLNRNAKRMLPALRFHVGMHEPACEREAEVAGLGK